MISDARVRALARQEEVTAGLAEKHYVNSWVLYSIYNSPLRDSVVFKGGTALSKLYFPEIWRFSEDLDFTATKQLPNVDEKLESELTNIEATAGITFEISNVHQAGNPIEYTQVDVQYDAVLGQKNTTNLDITFNEPLVFPVADHEHEFEDVPTFSLMAYSTEEIFVEKLRSLFQRARARDYYDVYRLLDQESFDDAEVVNALHQKASVHDVEVNLAQGLPNDDVEAVEHYWKQALNRLVKETLPFDTVVKRIDNYLQHLATVDG
ncbi:MAG: nucleotidyl transferase AbiEii/AbiGii toxin family protein [Halobacteria archaeon]